MCLEELKDGVQPSVHPAVQQRMKEGYSPSLVIHTENGQQIDGSDEGWTSFIAVAHVEEEEVKVTAAPPSTRSSTRPNSPELSITVTAEGSQVQSPPPPQSPPSPVSLTYTTLTSSTPHSPIRVASLNSLRPIERIPPQYRLSAHSTLARSSRPLRVEAAIQTDTEVEESSRSVSSESATSQATFPSRPHLLYTVQSATATFRSRTLSEESTHTRTTRSFSGDGQ